MAIFFCESEKLTELFFYLVHLPRSFLRVFEVVLQQLLRIPISPIRHHRLNSRVGVLVDDQTEKVTTDLFAAQRRNTCPRYPPLNACTSST